jgi:hypothetical protein
MNLTLTDEGLEAVEALLLRFATCFQNKAVELRLSRIAPQKSQQR